MKALPLVQVFYFRQVPLIGEQKMVEIMEVLCKCLDDEVVEVREMAATCVPISLRPEAVCRFDAPIPYRTLSGILRLSPRRSVIALKVRSALFLSAIYLRGRHTLKEHRN